MSEERTYKNALSSFYRLKNNYEKKYEDFVNKLVRNKELSKKEKQQKISTFKKKCVNCDKVGGTVFSITGDNLKATCGNTSDPCDLDIHIKRGAYGNIEETIEIFRQDTEESKKKIIIAKMDLLFGYKTDDEIEKNFEELKSDFDLNFTIYHENLLKLQNILNDSMKKVELKRLNNDIIFTIEEMKEVMNTYKKKPNDSLIKDVVETYQTRLIPLLEKQMEKKYTINKIEMNEEDGTYHLIQKKFDINQLYTENDESQVLSFKMKK